MLTPLVIYKQNERRQHEFCPVTLSFKVHEMRGVGKVGGRLGNGRFQPGAQTHLAARTGPDRR